METDYKQLESDLKMREKYKYSNKNNNIKCILSMSQEMREQTRQPINCSHPLHSVRLL
jgi:hypothetical protein